MTYQRIAQHLLEMHSGAESFEVDFGDEVATATITLELEKLGCTVRRIPFKTVLFVICPWAENLDSAAS
jgi:hypothetical protein